MKNNSNNPRNKRQDKDSHFKAQMKTVFQAFLGQPKTMLMVSIETGILRANICRYVAEWKKKNKIAVAGKGLCKISKHPAKYLTTNPKFYPKNKE